MLLIFAAEAPTIGYWGRCDAGFDVPLVPRSSSSLFMVLISAQRTEELPRFSPLSKLNPTQKFSFCDGDLL